LLEPELDVRLPRLGPTITPISALATIRTFCLEVEKLHKELAELGVTIPTLIVQEVKDLISLTEIVAGQGGSRPDKGSRR
jgi:hypothetical protein